MPGSCPEPGLGGRQTSVRCFSFLAPISRPNPWRRGAPRSCSHLGLAYPPLDPPRVVSPFEGVTSHLMHHTTSLPSLPAWSLHTAGARYVGTALLRPGDDFLCPGSVFLKRIEFVCLRRTARGASPGRPGAVTCDSRQLGSARRARGQLPWRPHGFPRGQGSSRRDGQWRRSSARGPSVAARPLGCVTIAALQVSASVWSRGHSGWPVIGRGIRGCSLLASEQRSARTVRRGSRSESVSVEARSREILGTRINALGGGGGRQSSLSGKAELQCSPFSPVSPFASLFPSSPSPTIRNSGREKGPRAPSTVCPRGQ